MTYPTFYNPSAVGDLYTPNIETAVTAGLSARLPPATADAERMLVILVDCQVDFIHPQGALSVPGAVDDTRRTIEWLLRNAHQITTIAASLDSHVPVQIFYPTWWRDPDGKQPKPYTVISAAEVAAERWIPAYEANWSREYVQTLETTSRKQLMIWPYHTMIGTLGHALMPALAEAIAYHSAGRGAQPLYIRKGSLPKTEYYSLLEPEVKVPNHPEGSLNTSFLTRLGDYDKIYIAGQAKSHCVLETVASIMRFFAGDGSLIRKLRILSDCMSSVAHPTIDFERAANERFAEYAGMGLRLVKADDVVY